MIEVFEKLLELIHQNQDSVLVTVIESTGSTPREKGARMLVTRLGRISGTIGGGTIEYLAEELGKICLEEKRSCTKDYNLAPNEVADLGMICGGQVKVLFQYIDPMGKGLVEVLTRIIDLLGSNQQCWLLSSVGEEQEVSFLVLDEDGKWCGGEIISLNKENIPKGYSLYQQPELTASEELKETESKTITEVNNEKKMMYFIEEFSRQGKVYIFGGGHVSQALVPVLRELDFYCVVLEDREDFLTEELFSTANERILVDFKNIEEKVALTEKDFAVVVTRSHQFDYELQKQLLSTPVYYIGVMGSKRKTATQKELLNEEGYSPKDIQRINMPIGVEIKAETLKELAISISAELILKRANLNKRNSQKNM